MNEYIINITYQTEDFPTDHSFSVRRRAQSPGAAITAVSALFTALSNMRYAVPNTDPVQYRPYIRITEINAQEPV